MIILWTFLDQAHSFIQITINFPEHRPSIIKFILHKFLFQILINIGSIKRFFRVYGTQELRLNDVWFKDPAHTLGQFLTECKFIFLLI